MSGAAYHALQSLTWGIAAGVLTVCLAAMGFPVAVLLRRLVPGPRISSAFCILAGTALFLLAAWASFSDGFGLAVAIPVTLAAEVLLLIALATITRSDMRAALTDALRDLSADWPVWLVFLFFEFLAALLLTIHLSPDDLNIITMGNSDTYQYAASASHLSGLYAERGNIPGYNFNDIARVNVFGAFSILGLAATVFQRLPIFVGLAPVVAGAALVATAVVSIARNTFRLPWLLALLFGLVLTGSGIFFLVAGNGFLAQTLRSGFLLLALAELLGTSDADIPHRQFHFASLIFLSGTIVLFVYPGLVVQDTLVLTGTGLLAAALGGPERPLSRRLGDGVIFAGGALFAVGLIVALAFRKVLAGILYFVGMSDHPPKWPLPLFSPLDLIGVPVHWKIDFHPTGTIEFAIVACAGLAALSAAWWERRRLGHGPIILVALALAASAGYLLVWMRYGPSYQQWKFASLYPFLFGFGIPAALIGLVWRRFPQPFGKIVAFLAATAMTAGAAVIAVAAVQNLIDTGVRMPRDLRPLANIDQMGLTKGLVVDLPNFQQRMLVSTMVQRTPLFFTGRTYYGTEVDLANVTAGFPVLRGVGVCTKPNDRHVGPLLLLTDKDRGIVPLGVEIPFTADGLLCYAASGLSGLETGRWSDGHLVTLTIRVPDIAGPVVVRVNAIAFVHPPAAPRQRMIVSLAGQQIDQFEATKGEPGAYEFRVPEAARPGNRIDLRFDLPDAISPASIRLGQDSRILAFQFQSFTVTAATPGPARP